MNLVWPWRWWFALLVWLLGWFGVWLVSGVAGVGAGCCLTSLVVLFALVLPHYVCFVFGVLVFGLCLQFIVV